MRGVRRGRIAGRDPDLQIAAGWRDQQAPNAEWPEQYGGNLSAAIAFLETSQAHAQAERQAKEAAQRRELDQARQLAEAQQLRLEQQQRAAARLRVMIAGLGVVAAIAIGASLVAARFWRSASLARGKAESSEQLARKNEAKAQRQAVRANRQKRRAEQSQREASQQRDAAKQARFAAARQAAGLLLDRGIEEAGDGESAGALHQFVQALRALPADDPSTAPIERVIRMNLSAWAETVPALEHVWPNAFRWADVALSPDGERIAIATAKEKIPCFRTATGLPVGKPLTLPDVSSQALLFAPDGQSLWVASPRSDDAWDKAQWELLSGELDSAVPRGAG